MITFRPAVRDETSLLIGIAGASGSGKTYSALRLAQGLAGADGKIAFIDTEAGRGLHYADKFRFDHADLKPPFTPEAYTEAIHAADAAGYRVVIVDSMSHEYAGEGGLQDIQLADLERMAGGDARKMERLTAPAWKNAKLRHKKMVSRLLQCRSHLVFCMRAEEKIKFEKVKDDRGFERTAIVPVGWMPICEKAWMFEMTLSVTMTPEAAGIPMFDAEGRPIHGKIQDQHRHAFPAGRHVTEESGRLLAAWARGESSAAQRGEDAAAPGGEGAAQSSRPSLPDLDEDAYVAYACDQIEFATDKASLLTWWNSDIQKEQRRRADLSGDALKRLMDAVKLRAASLPAAASDEVAA